MVFIEECNKEKEDKIEEIEPIRIVNVQSEDIPEVTIPRSMKTEFDKVHEVSHQFHDDQNADESS